MDYAEHERVYKGFVLFSGVVSVAALAIIAAIAVGGLKGAWLTGIFGVILTLIAAGIGVTSGRIGWRAPAVPLVLMLLALALMPGAAH